MSRNVAVPRTAAAVLRHFLSCPDRAGSLRCQWWLGLSEGGARQLVRDCVCEFVQGSLFLFRAAGANSFVDNVVSDHVEPPPPRAATGHAGVPIHRLMGVFAALATMGTLEVL